MIYFTLPNFNTNSKINFIISNIANINPEKIKEPIKFIANSGNYPYCYFNGSINNCYGDLIKYFDYQVICNQYMDNKNAIRLNLTNAFLTSKDFDNSLLDVILSTHHTGSCYIELNNLALKNYIEDKYPNYQFIYSMPYDNNNHIMTPDLINQLNDENIFDLITIPFNYIKDISFLKKIKNKSKIELTVNNLCKNCDLVQSEICSLKENELQSNYSGTSLLSNCDKRVPYTDSTVITLEEIVQKYNAIGIKHYKLVDFFQNPCNTIDFINFIIDYFIKDEYKNEIRTLMLKEVFAQ